MRSPTEDATRASLRLAGLDDVDRLAVMVRDYHATEGIEADVAAYPRILRPLLEPGDVGRIWLVDVDDVVAGYVAVCFGYSIEFRGRDAFVDEIYVVPALRGRGVGSRALELAVAECERLGLAALHLEVDLDNHTARELYRRQGFALRERYQLMTRYLR
jgi:ribosomal protein S18 acetylase RimI-like enzyme